MVSMFPEARIELLGTKPACRCDKLEDAIAVEAYMTDEVVTAEWKGRTGYSITNDIMELLDNYYVYGQCEDCKDSEEAP